MNKILCTLVIIFIVVILSCQKTDSPNISPCFNRIKLDTLWQVQLDRTEADFYPEVLNGQLMYGGGSLKSGNTIVIRNALTGALIDKIPTDIYIWKHYVYEDNLVVIRSNSSQTKLIVDLFNPFTKTDKYLDIPGHIDLTYQLNDALIGTTFDSATISFFSLNFKTQNLKIAKTITGTIGYTSYWEMEPFIDKTGDTLIEYTRVIADHEGRFGVYNLTKDKTYFENKFDNFTSQNIFNLEAGENVFAKSGSFSGANTNQSFSCYNTNTGALLWQQNLNQNNVFFPFTKVFGNRVFSGNKNEFSYLDANTGKPIWTTQYPIQSIPNKVDIAGNLLFLRSMINVEGNTNTTSIIIADLNTGCIYNEMDVKSQTDFKGSIVTFTDFCLDKVNRLLYITGADTKITCIKF